MRPHWQVLDRALNAFGPGEMWRRWEQARQLIRQQLDAGRLGEPGLVRVHRWEHADTEGASGDVPAALTQDMDTAVWLMGSAPAVVYAVQRAGEAALASCRTGQPVEVT